jgi:hypothetical protein
LVVKKPDGSTRLCVDYSTGLNDALQLHAHPLPVPEDIFTTLDESHVSSQIDFSDAYLQVELNNDSMCLCNINIRVFTNSSVCHLGVKSAPGTFQAIMGNMLATLPFATAYLDDFVVVISNSYGNWRHLHAVFDRMNKYGFRVRLEQCFLQPLIKCHEFIVDKDGRRPDPQRVSAVADMPIPSNITTPHFFLGLVNYYQSFVPKVRSN